MALAAVKTFIAGEVLTASDLNALNTNILNNPISLISPLTGDVSLNGKNITLDVAAATLFNSSASVAWNFTSGAKTGIPATTGSVANWSAQTFTDSSTAASGVAVAWTAFAIQQPTLVATNASVTTTDAATLYVANGPLASTNQTITNSWALWSVGNVRIDGNTVLTAGRIDEWKSTDIASAATVAIGAAAGNFIDITGTTTITAFDSIQKGARRTLRFTGILTLTHNAASLILPGAANITTASGDIAEMRSLGSGNWVCTSYQKASTPITASPTLVSNVFSYKNFT